MQCGVRQDPALSLRARLGLACILNISPKTVYLYAYLYIYAYPCIYLYNVLA